MYKKIFVSMLAVGVLSVGGLALAAGPNIFGRGRTDIKTSPKATPLPANIACVATAVNARESALTSGIGTYGSAVQTAYSVRGSALASAYSKTSTTEIRTAVKAAWGAFSKSVRDASKTWKTAQRSAWTTFNAAVKACKDTSGVSDEINSSQEVSGQ